MSSAHAAWYPLSNDHSTLRYWDGYQWTHHYRHWNGLEWAEGLRQAPARTTSPKARWVLTSAAAIMVLALGVTGLYFGLKPEAEVASGDGDIASAGGIETIVNGDIADALTSDIVYTDTSRGLDYTRPIVDIEARDGQIHVPLSKRSLPKNELPDWVVPTPRHQDGGSTFSWAFRMFADPDLEVEVGVHYEYVDYIGGGRDLLLSPKESAYGATLAADGEELSSRDVRVRENVLEYESESYVEPGTMEMVEDYTGQWGLRETYYVVRYISDDGEMTQLERPVVAKLSFTQSLPTPQVRVGTSSEVPGSIELSWDAIPDASSYGVFMSHAGWTGDLLARPQVLLGKTESTNWSPDIDAEVLTTSVQNRGMITGEGWEDGRATFDYYSLGTEYGVIAYDASGEKMSALGSVSANDESIGVLPHEVDFDGLNKEWRALPCRESDTGCSLDDYGVTAPYISVSGDIARGLTVATGVHWSDDWDGYAAVMLIEGTRLDFYRQIGTQDEDQAIAQVEAYNEKASGERLPTGDLNVVRETEIDRSAVVVSDVDPDVLDELNWANHQLVAYIASHMYEGHTAVDMSEYSAFWGSSDIHQAADVARDQNPSFGVWSSSYYDGVLYIEYRGRERAQEALAEVRVILDDLGVDAMTDTQKVQAINNYIVDHVEYDYAALELGLDDYEPGELDIARSLEGAVFDGLVVCVGYAMMFVTMANEAGLEAMYVTGMVTGSMSGHAWNKVKIDGEWKAVDPTWNDNGTGSNPYLLINDSDFTGSASRFEDSTWLMGSKSQYATP